MDKKDTLDRNAPTFSAKFTRQLVKSPASPNMTNGSGTTRPESPHAVKTIDFQAFMSLTPDSTSNGPSKLHASSSVSLYARVQVLALPGFGHGNRGK